MCQLLGMNSNKPISLQFSLTGFVRRGGDTDHHGDGWGIARFINRQWQVTIDDQPAAFSPRAEVIRLDSFKSCNAIVHIRKATHGGVSRANCHPFIRKLWGQSWAFAHNGDLDDLPRPAMLDFRPAGDTDSERAFCMLLNGLRTCFGNRPPSFSDLKIALQQLSDAIAAYGSFNYLLSNGEVLFAYCSTHLYWTRREAPFRSARLSDYDLSMNFAHVNHLDDCITMIATRPLTVDENWQPFLPGELHLFVGGRESRDIHSHRQWALAC